MMKRRKFLGLLVGGIAAAIGAGVQLFKNRTVGWRRKSDVISSVHNPTDQSRLIYALTSDCYPMADEAVAVAELVWNTPAEYDGCPIDEVLQREGIYPYPGWSFESIDDDGWTISTSQECP